MYLLIFIHMGTYKLLKDGRFQDTANINLILLSAFIFHLILVLVAVVTIVGMAVGEGGGGDCGTVWNSEGEGGGQTARRVEEGQVGVEEVL